MDAAAGRRINSLITAIAAASLTGCGFGLSLPLIALNLEFMTGSGVISGWNVMMSALATIILAPVLPMIMAKLPGRGLLAFACVLCGVSFLAFPLTDNLWLWAAFRFSLSIGLTIVFIVSEVWINQLAEDAHRGRLMGIYATSLSAGFALGAVLLALIGPDGWAPFVVAAAIFASGSLLTLLPGPGVEPPEGEGAHPFALARAVWIAPTAFAAALFFGAIETASMHFISVYGVRIGLIEQTAALFLFAAAIGNIAFQFPLGMLADRVGAFQVLILCAIGGTLIPLLLLVTEGALAAQFILFFFYAGIVVGMYTIGLVLLGERFKGGALGAANAAFVFMYGAGELFSPPYAGALMDAINPGGLMMALSSMAGAFLIFAVIRRVVTVKSR